MLFLECKKVHEHTHKIEINAQIYILFPLNGISQYKREMIKKVLAFKMTHFEFTTHQEPNEKFFVKNHLTLKLFDHFLS